MEHQIPFETTTFVVLPLAVLKFLERQTMQDHALGRDSFF
jgi:hypothetical protein